MPGIKIVTDSATDLRPALAAELGITTVPLTVRFGDDELVDGALTPKEFWARCDATPSLPETAAPSPGAFEAVFRAAADEGFDGVVCPTLSSGVSATFQSAQLAAQAVEGTIAVRVVDTRSVSMGGGLVVLEAARAAKEGLGVEEVAAAATDAATRTKLYAALDTLENLKRGGRIGAAQALFGSLLSIKPVIEVRDGVVEAESRQRTRSKSLQHLVDRVKEQPDIEHLAVMSAEAPDLETFLDQVGAVFDRDRIIVGDIGAVIGAHAGPRVLGVTFQTARR